MKKNMKALTWVSAVLVLVIGLLFIKRAKAQQGPQGQAIVVSCPNIIGRGGPGWIPRLENTYVCSVFDPNTERHGIIVHNIDNGLTEFVMEDK